MIEEASSTRQKPCLALMGEFSAGKSTLSNLLLGSDPLPVRVTATRLPPVLISFGEISASREDLDGNIYPLDVSQLETVQLEETRLIRLYLKSELLKLCDLIDMPGISDPNMESDVWRAVINEADHVIWCTHATQAWRQSEAAVWESLPENIRDQSLLLLTRFDKILSPRDRERVVTRVCRETKGLFSGVFPVSLTAALAAGEDRRAWEMSGADAFVQKLIGLLTGAHRIPELSVAEPVQSTPELQTPQQIEHPSTGRVVPSRVRPKADGQRRFQCRPQVAANHLKVQELLGVPGNA
jgi:predicted GTPase